MKIDYFFFLIIAWINICVAERNVRWFIAFLYATAFVCLYESYLSFRFAQVCIIFVFKKKFKNKNNNHNHNNKNNSKIFYFHRDIISN